MHPVLTAMPHADGRVKKTVVPRPSALSTQI